MIEPVVDVGDVFADGAAEDDAGAGARENIAVRVDVDVFALEDGPAGEEGGQACSVENI